MCAPGLFTGRRDARTGCAQPVGKLVQRVEIGLRKRFDFQCAGEGVATQRGAPALQRVTQIRAAAGALARWIDGDGAVDATDDPHQTALGAGLAASDTGPLRDMPWSAAPRG